MTYGIIASTIASVILATPMLIMLTDFWWWTIRNKTLTGIEWCDERFFSALFMAFIALCVAIVMFV